MTSDYNHMMQHEYRRREIERLAEQRRRAAEQQQQNEPDNTVKTDYVAGLHAFIERCMSPRRGHNTEYCAPCHI